MSPNFLIAGPPKCASTSLHFYLGQHPQIFVSPTKETHFFTHDYERGIKYYEKYFEGAGNARAIGEATPAYCFLPFACDRIKTHYPDMRIILCLRNPMERAFSHWLMLWSRGVEKAGFREAVEINNRQLSYINFEGDKGAALWNERAKNVEKGEKWPRIYLQPGMYSEIITRLQKQFGANHVHYYFMEDLKKDFSDTLKNVFTFLNIDNSFLELQSQEKNVYNDKKLYKLMTQILGVQAAKAMGKLMAPSVKNFFRQKKQQNKTQLPKLQSEDREFLWHIFKDDIARIEQITKRDLSHWNPINSV